MGCFENMKIYFYRILCKIGHTTQFNGFNTRFTAVLQINIIIQSTIKTVSRVQILVSNAYFQLYMKSEFEIIK